MDQGERGAESTVSRHRKEPEEPKEVAVAMLRLMDDGDLDGVDRVFSSEVVDHEPMPGAAGGIEGLRALFAAVIAGFSDIRHEIEYQAEIDAEQVVTVWRMRGRHTGDFLGIPATGRPVDFKGMDILRVRDGAIVEQRHVEQLLQAVQQVQN